MTRTAHGDLPGKQYCGAKVVCICPLLLDHAHGESAMLDRLLPKFVGATGCVGLLAIRVVAGSAMVLHGLPKIQNPTGWMKGSDMPGILQAAAAVAEFGGGVCWVLGALTPIASVLIACTMITGIFKVHLANGQPFVAPPGPTPSPSYELAAVYLAIAVGLFLIGPGLLSIDAIFFRPKPHLDRPGV
jgi:putative oxidoreductase